MENKNVMVAQFHRMVQDNHAFKNKSLLNPTTWLLWAMIDDGNGSRKWSWIQGSLDDCSFKKQHYKGVGV